MNDIEKIIDGLTFANDFVFGKVMENKQICKEVLQRLLKIKISRLFYPKLQKELKPYFDRKSIRLDVFAADSKRNFDVEMQIIDKGDLPQRMRYYQSLMDVDTLLKGHEYGELKESYVIFICLFDPFGKGLPVYEFSNLCEQDSQIKFDDKTRKVVYNVNAYKSEQDKKIHALLEYVKTKTPTDTFTIKLDNMVEEIKLSSKFRREYMIQNLALSDARRMGRNEGRTEGRREGRNEMALSTAKNLLSFGVNTLEQISQATGLALETVQKLAAEYANSKPQLATEIKF